MQYCAKNRKRKFKLNDWKRLKDSLDILPLGLNRTELKVLKALSEQPYTKLTNLSAKLGMSKSVIMRDFEMYLQKQGLFEIDPLGRQLTKKGREYLQELDWHIRKGMLPYCLELRMVRREIRRHG